MKRLLRHLLVACLPVALVLYPVAGVFNLLGVLLLSEHKRHWRWWYPMFAVVGAGLFASLVSDWRREALLQWLLMSLSVFPLALLFRRFPVSALAWLGGGAALAGLLLGWQALQEVFIEGRTQANSFFFHQNIAGGVALLTGFTLLGSLGIGVRWGVWLLYLSGGMMALVALVLSGSRGTYLGLAAGMAVYVLVIVLRSRMWSLRIVTLVLALFVTGLVWFGLQSDNWGVLEVMRPRIESLGQLEATSGGRVFMTLLGLEIASYKPFLGFGFGAWQQVVPIVEPSFLIEALPHSHNLYIELLLDGGSLLLVAVLMFFGTLGLALFRKAWSGSWVAAASFAGMVGFAVNNLFDVLAYQPYVLGLFWLLLVQGLVEQYETMG